MKAKSPVYLGERNWNSLSMNFSLEKECRWQKDSEGKSRQKALVKHSNLYALFQSSYKTVSQRALGLSCWHAHWAKESSSERAKDRASVGGATSLAQRQHLSRQPHCARHAGCEHCSKSVNPSISGDYQGLRRLHTGMEKLYELSQSLSLWKQEQSNVLVLTIPSLLFFFFF